MIEFGDKPPHGEVKTVEVTHQEIINLTSSADVFNIICMISPPRIGAHLFLVKLEHEHYRPGTTKNNKFQMYQIVFSDIVFLVASIPAADREIAEQVADECGLRLADGVPHVIDKDGAKQFPIHTDNTFSLENKSDSPVYQNSPDIHRCLLQKENEEIRSILASHEVWLNKHPEAKERDIEEE